MPGWASAEILKIGPGKLLVSLDRLVKQYQIEGEAAVARITRIETIVWLTALGLLVLEALLNFYINAWQASPPSRALRRGGRAISDVGETYDKLKEIDPDIKVLLSSGYSINGPAKKILDRGCNGFIQKPFSLKDLSIKVREALYA